MSNQLLFVNSTQEYTSKSFELLFAEGRLAESTSHLSVVKSSPSSSQITVEINGSIIADKFRGRSDVALKSDIKQVSDALATIKRIVGVSYKLREDSNESYGFIAQEVQTILPNIVQPDGEHLSISYLELLPFIVESIKDLDAKVEKLCKLVSFV
jgi:hypothetical protein|tara:strand:- start:2846 stop:3310 length:465 start_codon:yes stop_codon:yes gene_type:complete